MIETNMYDIEEIYPDCTVQVLRNSVTGEMDIGWWPNDQPPAKLNNEPINEPED